VARTIRYAPQKQSLFHPELDPTLLAPNAQPPMDALCAEMARLAYRRFEQTDADRTFVEQAVARDSGFARAWAGLAVSLVGVAVVAGGGGGQSSAYGDGLVLFSLAISAAMTTCGSARSVSAAARRPSDRSSATAP